MGFISLGGSFSERLLPTLMMTRTTKNDLDHWNRLAMIGMTRMTRDDWYDWITRNDWDDWQDMDGWNA